ncbi:GDSL-type esterase/lipase family protein [Mariniluteicoccus flavus]
MPILVRRLVATLATVATLAIGGLGGAHAARGWTEVSTYGSPDDATRIVVAGDSVAAGSNCDCDDYGQVLGDDLAKTRGGTVVSNIAVGGQTSGELVDQLAEPEATDTLADADIVVITIGANDVAVDDPEAGDQSEVLRQLAANLDSALSRVRAAAPAARIVVTGYWNVGIAGEAADEIGPDYVAAAA